MLRLADAWSTAEQTRNFGAYSAQCVLMLDEGTNIPLSKSNANYFASRCSIRAHVSALAAESVVEDLRDWFFDAVFANVELRG